jgi:hypothetical protein
VDSFIIESCTSSIYTKDYPHVNYGRLKA